MRHYVVRGGALVKNAPPKSSYRWRIFQNAPPLRVGQPWIPLYVAHLEKCATPKNLIGGAFWKCATPKELLVAHPECATHKLLGVAHFPYAPLLRKNYAGKIPKYTPLGPPFQFEKNKRK